VAEERALAAGPAATGRLESAHAHFEYARSEYLLGTRWVQNGPNDGSPRILGERLIVRVVVV
jgi:hypothetical protein